MSPNYPKFRIRWENQVPWLYEPSTREQLGLFFDLDKLFYDLELQGWHTKNIVWDSLGEVHKMSDLNELVGQGGVESSPSYVAYDMAQAKVLRAPNMKEKLELAVVQAEARLKDAKEARDILTKNPDLEKLLDILQRNHF